MNNFVHIEDSDSAELFEIKEELLNLMVELQEMTDGRGMYRKAAEHAVEQLFAILGEPGAGE